MAATKKSSQFFRRKGLIRRCGFSLSGFPSSNGSRTIGEPQEAETIEASLLVQALAWHGPEKC
jgi:hypothetical protein